MINNYIVIRNVIAFGLRDEASWFFWLDTLQCMNSCIISILWSSILVSYIFQNLHADLWLHT